MVIYLNVSLIAYYIKPYGEVQALLSPVSPEFHPGHQYVFFNAQKL